jgi:DNA-binding response OmpR family regulator
MNQTPNVTQINVPRTVSKLIVAKFNADPEGSCEIDVDTLSDAIALLKLQEIIDDNPLDLTPIEGRIYRTLSLALEHDVDYATLMNAAGIKTHESLWVHMRRLRTKLEPSTQRIRTISEYGYRLVTEMEEANARNN